MTLKRALERPVRKSEIPDDTRVEPLCRCGRPKHLMLGEMGESIAARYLVNKGYILIDNNVRVKCGEIDIIARHNDEIVFVEVRTRSVGKVLPADRSVGPDKLRKLVRASRAWADSRNYEGFWRIDLIAITITESGKIEIEHISDITEGIT